MNKGSSVCESLPLRKEWLEKIVLDAIRSRFQSPDVLDFFALKIREKTDSLRKSYACDSKQLEAKLGDLDRRIANFVEAIGNGADPAMCQAQIADLKARKVEVDRQASRARRGEFAENLAEKNLAALRRVVGAVNGNFHELPFHAQRQVVMHFVSDAIVLNRETLHIEFQVPFDGGGVTKLADELSGVIVAPRLGVGMVIKPAGNVTNAEPLHALR
jgi:hypothetical protein